MATYNPGSDMNGFTQPEFNLLKLQDTLDRSTLGSLVSNIRDALFPQKLPPLQLTSKPVRVRDIWGQYNYKKRGAAGSTLVHVGLVVALVGLSIAGRQAVTAINSAQQVELVAPDLSQYMPMTAKKQISMGGGGGGGDRDKLQAPKGKLPKVAMEQITPPAMVIRNLHPLLPVEPTVVLQPEVKLATNMPTIGDPLSKVTGPPSNGTGSGSGIGSGNGGGIGSGSGPGVGPGTGGGFGGGVFRVGGGVSAPKAIDTPDPEYSEEARKAKYQGTCVLWLIVDSYGHPQQIKISRSLGMGLDQKAIEAVRRWRFEPATKDGRPVAVQINVEVNFRLY